MDSYMISISLSHCPSFVINIKRYVTSDKHTRAYKYYNYGVSFNSVFSCRVDTYKYKVPKFGPTSGKCYF